MCSALGSNARGECLSTGEALASALNSGQARVLPDGVANGRPVKRIPFSTRDTGVTGTYEIDPNSNLPVRITAELPGASGSQSEVVVEEYSLFEYLPATAENLAAMGVAP